MAEEVYVVSKFRPNPERFDLSEDEWQQIREPLVSEFEAVGGEIVLHVAVYNSSNSSIRIMKFPELDAWRKYRAVMSKLNLGKYFTSEINVCFDPSGQ